MIKYFLIVILIGTLLSSCVSVKEYQKMYLNDRDMGMSDSKVESFEKIQHTYREAAAGANGGKTGGGCGCN